jgi:TrmH family RNA methyltransferase
MTLARVPEWDLDAVLGGESLVVVLDGIQDPGNAGAILRTAEAFGATGAIYLKGTVSPYNPKAIRASAGSVFRLPMVAGVDADFACAALEQAKLEVFAAMPQAAQRLGELDLRRRCAIVIGSEARGVSPRMQEIARGVRIPTSRVESLNAAMAAGILLYEANRQRQAVA